MSIKKLGIVSGILFALVVAVTPVIAACDLQNPSECTNEQLVALIQQLLSGGTTTPTTPTTGGTITGIPQGFQFTTNLMQTSTGNDVRYLQILLNSDAATRVAVTGAGSPGNETTYFGPATRAAVIKFQNKYASEILAPYGLTSGTGYFGVSSRTKANALIASGVTPPPTGTCPTSAVACVTAGYNWINGVCVCDGTVPPVIGTDFRIALAASNPASGTLVEGQATANLLETTFSNGTSSEVRVTAVELTRLGVSADATLANVYLFDGVTRITDAGTISAGKVTFNDPNGVIVIPANSSKTISVKADIAGATSGQTVGVSVSAITSSTTLSNTVLPIAGNTHTIAAATLATVTVGGVTPGNTTTDPMDEVNVWQSTINIGIRNVNVTKLALRQINSIESKDISNFRLLIDGEQVAQVQNVDANGFVTFVFNKTLTTGNKIFRVIADITGGSGRVAQFSLRNKADIDAKDSEYNVNVAAGGAIPGTTGTITINPGNITITKTTDSPSGTVANNASSVTLAKYEFKAYGEPIKIETLKAGFTIGGGGGAISLRNGKIVINGTQYGSTAHLVDAGTTYTVNYVIQPGQTAVVEIVADIYAQAGVALASGHGIQAKIIQLTSNATRQVSLGLIHVPDGVDVAGNGLQVSEGTMALIKTATYADPTSTVVPQTNFLLGSWNLTGSNTEAINLNTFTVNIATVTGATFDQDDLKSIYLKYGNQTSSIKSSAGAANEWSISYSLARNESMLIELYGNIGTTIDTGNSMRATLKVDGVGAMSSATVTQTTGGQEIKKDVGTLVGSIDASTPDTAILDDTGTVKTASYKFEANNDSYVIVEATVTVENATVVSAVKLMDGATILATRPGSVSTTFTGIQIPVSSNQTKVIDVAVDLAAVGFGAGNTGADITTRLTAGKARANSTGVIDNIPGVPLAAGNALYVYKAIPTISLVTLPSGTLNAGTNVLSKFSINTTGTGTIGWKKMVFTVTKTVNPTIADTGAVQLWDADSGTQVAGVGLASGLTGGAATGSITFVPTTEQQISGAKTYELRVNVGGAPVANDYINTSIARPSVTKTPSNKAFATGTVATTFAYLSGDATVTAGNLRQAIVPSYTAVNSTSDGAVITNVGTSTLTKFKSASVGNLVLNKAVAVWTVDGTSDAAWTGATINGAPNDMICPTGVTATTGEVVTFGGGITCATGSAKLTVTLTEGTYAVGSVVGATNSDVGLALTAGVPATASFLWSDVSAQSHSIFTTDWTTDFLVRNLPTSTQNLVK